VTELRSQRGRHHSRGRNGNMSRPLLRALLAMSVADIFFTIPWFLTTWMAPADLDYLWGNVGNQATCTFQGWMFQFGVQSGPLFNCTYSFFSLLLVAYQWNERDLIRIEPWFHGGIWTYALAASIFPIPLGLYNNVWQICWLEGYPYDCQDSWSYGDEADCTRGDNGWIYAIAFTFFPPWMCMLMSLVIMYLIWRSVRRLEQRLSRYAGSMAGSTKRPQASVIMTRSSKNHPHDNNENQQIEKKQQVGAPAPMLDDSCVSHSNTPTRQEQRTNTEKSKAVAQQAMWYITAFLVTFLLDAILSVLYYGDFASEKALEPLDFFAYLVYPLQVSVSCWTRDLRRGGSLAHSLICVCRAFSTLSFLLGPAKKWPLRKDVFCENGCLVAVAAVLVIPPCRIIPVVEARPPDALPHSLPPQSNIPMPMAIRKVILPEPTYYPTVKKTSNNSQWQNLLY